MKESKQNCRYQARFSRLKAGGQKAFIPFTLLGWPNPQTAMEIIRAMRDGGASALELGLAFSDPMSDGPVIQQAAMETLNTGYCVDDAMALLKDVRSLDDEIPIGLLVYFNMVLARGVDRFFGDAAQAGVDGVLIVDLPPELSGEVLDAAQAHGVQLIYIVSPLTNPQRLEQILSVAGGFLYIVSRLGITGTEERYDDDLKTLLDRVRQNSSLPCCVGFGISTPDQAKRMLSLGADGVITGSRIIQVVDKARQQQLPVYDAVRTYVEQMVSVTKQAIAAKDTVNG